jgi:hypothetical protein
MTPSLAPGRSCDACTLCCKLAAVHEISKPRMQDCPHCAIGVGCKIYETRPGACRTFFCEYRLNAELGEEWKPNLCNIVVTVERQARRINVLLDDGHFDAWRKEPYYSQIKTMALNILRQRGHLIVWEGLEGIGILPHKEVRLGRPQANQVIVAGRRMTEQGEEFDIMALDRNDPRLKPSS